MAGMSYAPSGYKTNTQKSAGTNIMDMLTKPAAPSNAPLGPPSQKTSYVLKPGGSSFQPNASQPGGGTLFTGPTGGTSAARSAAPSGGAYTGASGGGGGGVATGSATGQVGTSAPTMPSDEDWWNSDDAYHAQLGGIGANKDSALANLTAQRQNYDTDLQTTLKNLGRSGADITQWGNQQGFGDWDPTNQSGAYGQGKTNLQNDFASRGMGDSSYKVTADDQFNNDMNAQFQNLVQGRGSFQKARGQEEADANATYANALAQAKAESIARRAAQYGV